MTIIGNKIVLRPAREDEREKVFRWLAQSDLTSTMLGPPTFPDHPIPSWEEFCDSYPLSFFNSEGDGSGRNYIIMTGNEEAGIIGYDLLDKEKNQVWFDIWMSSSNYCGHGYGSDALVTLCNHIHKNYSITSFHISPSARNERAVAAYKKAGFEYIKIMNREEQITEFGEAEYDDNVLMVKKIPRK